MNFLEFQKKYGHLPLIRSRDLVREIPHANALRNQLRRWQSRNLVMKMRRGVYVLAGAKKPEVNWLANQLYAPSYVSLESALNFYGLIPERVADIVSVTTLKTLRFQNESGSFVYRHLKPAAFRGFKAVNSGKFSFLMADPEKALVDFFYFHLPAFAEDVETVIQNSYRLQNYEDLDTRKLRQWAALFDNAKLDRVVKRFCQMIPPQEAP